MSNLNTQPPKNASSVDFVQRHLANGTASILLGFGVFLLVQGGWHPGAFTQLGASFFFTTGPSEITELAINSGVGAAIICFALLLLRRP